MRFSGRCWLAADRGIAVLIFVVWHDRSVTPDKKSYTEFMHELDQKNIKSIVVRNDGETFTLCDS